MPWSPNRRVCSSRLNSPRLSHCRSLESNEFHRRGPAVTKHRPLKVLCDRRTERIAVFLYLLKARNTLTRNRVKTVIEKQLFKSVKTAYDKRVASKVEVADWQLKVMDPGVKPIWIAFHRRQ